MLKQEDLIPKVGEDGSIDFHFEELTIDELNALLARIAVQSPGAEVSVKIAKITAIVVDGA